MKGRCGINQIISIRLNNNVFKGSVDYREIRVITKFLPRECRQSVTQLNPGQLTAG
ncbi:hypothetical protein SDC9_94406 [bioreactor metagenome]|uniref:Uncharacterized protein n=1 Tax=bioreactor metagenome TaxID=1076179 RepID=A0A645AA40_9ZZZZ